MREEVAKEAHKRKRRRRRTRESGEGGARGKPIEDEDEALEKGETCQHTRCRRRVRQKTYGLVT